MSDPYQQCPGEWNLQTHSSEPRRLCGRGSNSAGCLSAMYNTYVQQNNSEAEVIQPIDSPACYELVYSIISYGSNWKGCRRRVRGGSVTMKTPHSFALVPTTPSHADT